MVGIRAELRAPAATSWKIRSGTPERLEERLQPGRVGDRRGDGEEADEPEDARDEEGATDDQAAASERASRAHLERGRSDRARGWATE